MKELSLTWINREETQSVVGPVEPRILEDIDISQRRGWSKEKGGVIRQGED